MPSGSRQPHSRNAAGRMLAAGLLALSWLAACLAPAARAQQLAIPQGMVQRSVLHDGLERLWLVYAPPGLPPNPAAVVLLHGGTQSMRKLFGPNAGGSRAWLDLARANRFVLLVPNGVDPGSNDPASDWQSWNVFVTQGRRRRSSADDVGFIGKMLDDAYAAHGVDPARVYATGSSNGGMMTFRLLIETPERFAAGAAFIASLPGDLSAVPLPGLRRPLMVYNGTLDRLVRYAGGRVGSTGARTAPVPAMVEWWVRALGANAPEAVRDTLPDRNGEDGCRIERTRYPAGAGGAPLEALVGVGGGHAMPSSAHPIPDTFLVRRLIGPQCRDAEGAELAWKFFSGR